MIETLVKEIGEHAKTTTSKELPKSILEAKKGDVPLGKEVDYAKWEDGVYKTEDGWAWFGNLFELDESENGENTKTGGRYGDLKKQDGREGKEVHHMPAKSTSELDENDGPAIIMEKEDHKKTASFGNSKEAQEYRAKQKELIDEGKFDEALQMDIDDIKEKFGDKYDDAIEELKEYYNELKEKGKV